MLFSDRTDCAYASAHASRFQRRAELRGGLYGLLAAAALGGCNPIPDVILEPQGGLVTSEDGTSLVFNVRLARRPVAVVKVRAVSSDPSEGQVSNPVEFNRETWANPQAITVTGVDDATVDGDVTYQVSFETEVYDSVEAIASFDVVNVDDDVAQPAAGYIMDPGGTYFMGEPSGTAKIGVKLISQPMATVTVPVTTSGMLSLSPPALVFTPDNWNVTQAVQIDLIDDLVGGSNHLYTVDLGPCETTDPNYAALPQQHVVSVRVQENDVAAILVSKYTVTTSEIGESDTFTVWLTSQPRTPTTFRITSSVPTEATVMPTTIVFDAANWNVPQVVTVTGVQDIPAPVKDGDQVFTITVSPDPAGSYTNPPQFGPVIPPIVVGVNREGPGEDAGVDAGGDLDAAAGDDAGGDDGGTDGGPVQTPKAARAIACGSRSSCAALTDGSLWCWGAYVDGVLIEPTTIRSSVPVEIAHLSGVLNVTAGSFHNCALLSTGSVHCWGDNLFGEVGDGTTSHRAAPVAVLNIDSAVGVSAGSRHSCALLANGSARCWGWNQDGQLGTGSGMPGNSLVPVTVVGLGDVAAVSAGTAVSCAVLRNGAVECWGNNSEGQLGDSTNTSRSTPKLLAIASVKGIATGKEAGRTCALLNDGTIQCWGRQTRVLSGALANSSVPVLVEGVTEATRISVGGFGNCAVIRDGSVKCWVTAADIPTIVPGIETAVDVSVGGGHACVLLSSGSVRCWGGNQFGELGDGSELESGIPMEPRGSDVPLTVVGF